MTFMANTRVALVVPGTAEDAYGDPVGVTTPDDGAKTYKASIIERSRTVFDDSTNTLRTIRYAVGRFMHTTPIAENTTIYDRRTGKVWVVDEIIDIPRTIGGASDVRVILRDTSGE